MDFIDIVFESMPGPDGAIFVEVEDASGKSMRLGNWIQRPDGYAVIRLTKQCLSDIFGEDVEPCHQTGCVCADCSGAELTADND